MKMVPNPDGELRDQDRRQAARDDHAEQRAHQGQQHAFDQQLRHQAAPRGTDGEAHRHFTLARAGPRQQQVREVGARDQQHEAGRAEQHRQRLAELRRECSTRRMTPAAR